MRLFYTLCFQIEANQSKISNFLLLEHLIKTKFSTYHNVTQVNTCNFFCFKKSKVAIYLLSRVEKDPGWMAQLLIKYW